MNSTKLSAFCDKALEIGWLLAVIITPLFFNVYSSRVFEPDKLTTLRTVALIMAALWVVKYIEERVSGRYELEISWRTPLVLPTLFTVIVYLLSTFLSVTPWVSFFGSYQRLQGTYTTLSYIVVFLVILQGLRTREQMERLITVVILNSLPIALYGLIQRNRLDPLPWGGDVTRRVASNMGNAIFVAAYLIMAALPTLSRILKAFRDILTDEEANAADIPRAAAYIFLFLVQLIAIWYTQSRGPLMGLLAGLGIWVLLGMLALQRIMKRRMWIGLWSGSLVLVIVFAVGFLLINLSGPIHQWALEQPALSRVARVLQYQGGTGMVRNLIWEGALDLISPHEPIEFPPTEDYPEGRSDPYNSLRLLVGYGPESMYVAYNPFYPPLLGHYESRTASPDRSHNETMDSWVITGLLGFVAYIWIFGGVFYYALRWMGFLPLDWRRTLFFALLAGGAIVAVILITYLIGFHFFGLAVPIGMVGGLAIYLLVYGFSTYKEPENGQKEFHPYFIFLMGMLSAIVAHFVEINFGIAIASTRTTFWAYAGAMVVAGMGLVQAKEAAIPANRATGDNNQRSNRGRRRRRRRREPTGTGVVLPSWLWSTLVLSIIGGFVLGTLAFDFVTNAERLTEPLRIVWRALTVLPAQNSRTSYGALMIFALTWIMGGVIFISELAKLKGLGERKGDGTLAVVLYMLVSLTVGLGFALILTGQQAGLMQVQAQTIEDVLNVADRVAGFLAAYYGFIFFTLTVGGLVLFLKLQRQPERVAQPWGIIALIVLMVLFGAIAKKTNLQPIQADIIYKQADPYDRSKQWLVAIEHYKHAIELTPKEDFYYLYLGRAYLEYASSLDDPAVREAVMQETEETLTRAREINPLNTDHSANLARMYRRWADFASGDPERRRVLLQKSSENYDIATMLSPQNAILWNEWAMLYYYGLGDLAGFERTNQYSLDLDPEFDQTWLVRGDVYRQEGDLEEAIRSYETALELNPRSAQVWRMLGDTYISMQQWDDAIHALTQTVELQPKAKDIWNVHQVLARLYSQVGENDQALVHAQTALELAPEGQQPALQELVAQIQKLETP